MKKVLNANGVVDEKSYDCTVFGYDAKQECIYLVLESDKLPTISLDAIYECRIDEGESLALCTGRVKERYENLWGKTLRFQIENGFYKINLKSVDK